MLYKNQKSPNLFLKGMRTLTTNFITHLTSGKFYQVTSNAL